MPKELTSKTAGLMTLSLLMILFSYLFELIGKSSVAVFLLFIGIFLAVASVRVYRTED